MDQMRTARRPFLATAALAATLTVGLTACSVGGGGEATESPTASEASSEAASASTEASPSTSESASSSPSAATESASSIPSAVESASSAPATETESPAAASSATASPSASGSASSAPLAASEVTVYWVALAGEDPAGIEFPGCGDTLIEETEQAPGAGAVGEPSRVEAGIQALLDQSENEVGESGLINALYQSELEVRDVSIEGDVVTVDLAGTPISAGTCDDPRIISQLEYTAIANAGAYTAEVLVDGEPIADVMSQAGA